MRISAVLCILSIAFCVAVSDPDVDADVYVSNAADVDQPVEDYVDLEDEQDEEEQHNRLAELIAEIQYSSTAESAVDTEHDFNKRSGANDESTLDDVSEMTTFQTEINRESEEQEDLNEVEFEPDFSRRSGEDDDDDDNEDNFVPEHNKLDEQPYTLPPYYEVCHRFHVSMAELQIKHPHIALVIQAFIEKLIDYITRLEYNCDEADIVVKLLEYIVVVAEEMKVTHGVSEEHIPPPVHIPTEPYDELYPGFVGSMRGVPGVDYPNYTEVPLTSFSCSDKYIPGFYADLETGCQVFHVCYEHRRESFLCPVGTIFNQPILACDYWYSSNCSLATAYYEVNERKEQEVVISEEIESNFDELITTVIEGEKPKTPVTADKVIVKNELKDIVKFLPIKAKIVEFPVSKPRVVPVKTLPVSLKPVPMKPLPMKPLNVKAAIPVTKVKLAAAVPIAAKAKFSAAVVPVAAKVKVSAIPVAKVVAGVPLAKAAVVAPAIKFAAPVAKAKVVAPAFKLAGFNHKVKFPAMAVKAKFAKSAAISPFTKKVLAVGYMKLLKAKKFAFMG